MKREPLLVAAPFSGTRVQPYLGTKRYLSTGDLQNDSISFEDVTYEGRPSRADICVEIEDVLFARMKSTRKVLLIGEELQNIIVSTGFAILRPEKNVSAKYLVTYLKSDEFERQKEKYCSGAIQPAITNNGIQKLTIPLPPLDDQKRIAHLLGKVEGMIARRKQHLQQLDELLKSVFLEMFGDPVRNEKGWEKKPMRSCAVRMSDGPFGSNLKTIHYEETGIQVIRLNNIGKGEFLNSDKAFVGLGHYEKVLKKYSCYSGDVVIATMGDPNVRACIVPRLINVAINKADCVSFKPNKDIVISEYIVGLINSEGFLSLAANLFHGQTRTRVSMGQLAKLLIPVPPINLQNKFAAIVEKVESLKSHYQSSLSNLENLYGALSQKAFKGELDLGRVPLPVEEKIEMGA